MNKVTTYHNGCRTFVMKELEWSDNHAAISSFLGRSGQAR
jgi:hypothetical protein